MKAVRYGQAIGGRPVFDPREQMNLLDPPIARKRDPETSRTAAVEYDGKRRGKDCALLLDYIRRYPGHTASEYSERLIADGVHWYKAARMPTRRVHDLLERGDVWAGRARTCRITGRKAQVYYPSVLA